MRTWVDTDKICEDTLNIIKLLSTSDVIKFSDVSEKIILLEECLDEEEYECGWFSDAAFKLLKDLLRIRIKLRKTDPTHHLVPVLIQAVDGLKEQLRLNRKHANELRPGVSEEGRNDEITAAERQKPGQKGLSLSAAIVPERALASQKQSGRTCTVFMAGMVTGAFLMLAALLMYPQTVIALLRMVVQVIHSAGEQSW